MDKIVITSITLEKNPVNLIKMNDNKAATIPYITLAIFLVGQDLISVRI